MYVVFFREHTVSHTHAHRQDCRKAVTRPEHYVKLVLILCKWIILIIVSTLFPFFYFPNDKHCLLDWSNVTVRLASPHPPDPVTPTLYLYEGPDMVQKSSFLHVSVKCKEWGLLMSMVGVCVVCDIVQRV